MKKNKKNKKNKKKKKKSKRTQSTSIITLTDRNTRGLSARLEQIMTADLENKLLSRYRHQLAAYLLLFPGPKTIYLSSAMTISDVRECQIDNCTQYFAIAAVRTQNGCIAYAG